MASPSSARLIATWRFGRVAVRAAWPPLGAGGSALDAVEAGARAVEADPAVESVGFGGLPDAAGQVTLDAGIMAGDGSCGAVACLGGIRHAVSVARRVMERTRHVLLVGEAAREFARSQGFAAESLLTPAAEGCWRRWLDEHGPDGPPRGHDTVGVLARDAAGRLAASCSTSGLAFKRPGRVGDSPLVGAGFFADDAAGAACATGDGESILRSCGSFLVVELMRRGASPGEACAEAVARCAPRDREDSSLQLAFIALAPDGRWGAASLRPGFEVAEGDAAGERLHAAPSLLP